MSEEKQNVQKMNLRCSVLPNQTKYTFFSAKHRNFSKIFTYSLTNIPKKVQNKLNFTMHFIRSQCNEVMNQLGKIPPESCKNMEIKDHSVQ